MVGVVDMQAPSAFAAIPVIPFDHDSPQPVIARSVLPEVVAALAQGGGVISVDGILRRTHNIVYEVMLPTGGGSGSELRPLRRRVAELMNDAMGNEFSAWLDRSSSEQQWRFKRGLPHDSAGKTRDLRLLRRLADQMLARLGAPAPAQLSLFDDAALRNRALMPSPSLAHGAAAARVSVNVSRLTRLRPPHHHPRRRPGPLFLAGPNREAYWRLVRARRHSYGTGLAP